jgi:fructose-1,6-bisphosphatase/inositol monophosphatase family enzyme
MYVYTHAVIGEGWKPWDYAAGSLILTEAGGSLSDVHSAPFHIYADSIVAAASPELCHDTTAALGEVLQTK